VDRVFLDANILFSAAMRPKAGLLRLWALEDVTLITSDYAIEEARRNLELPAQKARLTRLLRKIEIVAFRHFTLPRGVTLPAKDRPILLAAIDAGATHLLTGDWTTSGRTIVSRSPAFGSFLPPNTLPSRSLGLSEQRPCLSRGCLSSRARHHVKDSSYPVAIRISSRRMNTLSVAPSSNCDWRLISVVVHCGSREAPGAPEPARLARNAARPSEPGWHGAYVKPGLTAGD
jgi:predicted nucleic acid-binding protein